MIKLFKVADIKGLLTLVHTGSISFSKMVEELNNSVDKYIKDNYNDNNNDKPRT